MQFIRYRGTETLSFRQLDELNDLPKGSSFRVFKRHKAVLEEGRDYFYLPAEEHPQLIERLRREGLIYGSTVHLVLITRSGYKKLNATG